MSSNRPTRRELLQAVAAVSAAAVTGYAQQTRPSSPTTSPSKPYCYVDGYHGGVDGHMPAGSLRDVLDGLEKFPRWKVSFEIEPYSWAAFTKIDAPAIERLRRHLDDHTAAARVELVSGAYAQPYAWNVSGESNIRQLMYGIAEIKTVFPNAIVDTYAVQEPCWTSCLPQLLKSLGYRRACLKNSTCWGGYHAATVDADVVNWVGPDGTSIPTVPRYAMEKLLEPANEEAAEPPADFVERCLAAGIANPAGTILQDMGWAGRPWRAGRSAEINRTIRHVIWREYVDSIATPPTKQWKASQEDMRVGLSWGGSILQRVAQIVRISENLLVQAEKIAAMATVRRGAAFPGEQLKELWISTLLSQHHDGWIVPYNQNRNRGGTWAAAADARFAKSEPACKQIVRNAATAMASAPKPAGTGVQHIRLFNTTGFRRRDLAAVALSADEATRSFRVLDGEGKPAPCQVVGGGDAATTRLLFPAEVPAMGYATFKVEAAPQAADPRQKPIVSASARPDGEVVMETDLYRIRIDAAKGGRISSLFAKELNREFVDNASPRSFNEYRGFFSTENKWLSSADSPAVVTIVEQGPVRLAVQIAGRIGPHPFTTRLSMAAGQRRIDLQATFDFPVDAPPFTRANQAQRFRVGEPWERGREVTRSNRRPCYDSFYKLQALFPVALARQTLHKNAPFDVCRSTLDDTRFNTWDTIKHNIILNWVDVTDGDGSAGLAVLSDHTTAYSHGKNEPLGLVMCYAGLGNWFDYALGRAPAVSYAIVPHANDWSKARLWREQAQWGEPLVAQVMGEPARDDAQWSLCDASGTGWEVTTGFVEGGQALLRLFNAEGDAGPQELALAPSVQKAELVELDGRLIGELPIGRAASGNTVRLSMPRFGVRTLRLSVAGAH
jgi:alpha-mannosidase